jgi:hypothetical protein
LYLKTEIIVINISVTSLSFSYVTYLTSGSCFHHLFFWKVNFSTDTKPPHIGEAVFVDDIPSPKDCVYGAFIYSTKPLAHVKSIELDLSLKQLKTLGVVTVKDIPEGGSNVGANTIFGPEPLFGDPITQCAGEPLGVVVWFVVIFLDLKKISRLLSFSNENYVYDHVCYGSVLLLLNLFGTDCRNTKICQYSCKKSCY